MRVSSQLPVASDAWHPSRFTKRDIGLIGRLTRALGGAVALAVPISLGGLQWWDLVAGLVGLPLIAALAFLVIRAAYERWIEGGLSAQSGTCWGAACWLIAIVVAILIPTAALTPISGTALWIWIGASLLLAAARGYGGCEILAFPNALTGRRDQVGCLIYSPIDRAEARHKARRDSGTGTSDRAGSSHPRDPLSSVR